MNNELRYFHVIKNNQLKNVCTVIPLISDTEKLNEFLKNNCTTECKVMEIEKPSFAYPEYRFYVNGQLLHILSEHDCIIIDSAKIFHEVVSLHEFINNYSFAFNGEFFNKNCLTFIERYLLEQIKNIRSRMRVHGQ